MDYRKVATILCEIIMILLHEQLEKQRKYEELKRQLQKTKDEFKESEHKRDKDGKFASNGGSGNSKQAKEIKDFYHEAIKDKSSNKEIKIGETDSAFVSEAKEFGYDLKGYTHVLTSRGIRHSYEGHGGKNEKDKLQRGLTAEDFARVPDIIKNYDDITIYPKLTPEGRVNRIKYSKKYPDGTITYIEQIIDSQERKLITINMWKKKK